MNWEKINSWIQSATAVAIVLGLVLVIVELRQGKEIAKIEQASTGFAEFSSSVRTLIGDNGAAAAAKACDAPDSLTTEDMIILSRVNTDLLNRMRASFYRQRASEELTAFGWQGAIGNFSEIFATDFGKWWWSQQQFWEPEIVEAGNTYLTENPLVSCKSYFDGYRNRNQSAES